MRVIVIIFCLTVSFSYAQDGNRYHILKRKAEEHIIKKEFKLAMRFYDTAFMEGNYPFVRDVAAAACVAYHANELSTLYKYLEICLNRGISKEEFEYFEDKLPKDIFINNVAKNFNAYRTKYLRSIDMAKYDSLNKYDRDNYIIGATSRLFSEADVDIDRAVLYSREYSKLQKDFVNYVNKHGYPSETEVGIGGSRRLILSTKGISSDTSLFCIEKVDFPERLLKNKEVVYYVYSYKENTFIRYLSAKPGRYMIWHFSSDLLPEYKKILEKAVHDLIIEPSLLASGYERIGYDYGYSMASKCLWAMNFDKTKYNILSKEKIEQINKNRLMHSLRTLEEDARLHRAILEIEDLKHRHYSGKRPKGRNFLYSCLFIGMMP